MGAFASLWPAALLEILATRSRCTFAAASHKRLNGNGMEMHWLRILAMGVMVAVSFLHEWDHFSCFNVQSVEPIFYSSGASYS